MMNLRKTNAVFSLISTILLLTHAIYSGVWLLSRCSLPKAPSAIPRALTIFFLLHAIISIVLMVTSLKGGKGNKVYLKLNAATVVQRVSGVLMIAFVALHVLHVSGAMMLLPLLFLLVLAHVAVSTSKAFVTLGIGNARFIKYSDVAVKVICAVTLMVDIIGFYLCV